MTSRLEHLTAELAALFERYSYESEARFFEGVLSAIRETDNSPEAQKDIARDKLSAYRGMGSLNDLVIMVDGKVDGQVNDHLVKLLRELRTVAIDVATGSTG
jgi:hypothetical protein